MNDLLTIRQTLLQADLCSLSVLAVVAFYIGKWLTIRNPRSQRVVTWVCLAIFVGWLGIDLQHRRIERPADALTAVMRSTVFTSFAFPAIGLVTIVVDGLLEVFWRAPWRCWNNWTAGRRRRRIARQEEKQRRKRDRESQLAWERDRPAREAAERARQAAAEREARLRAIQKQDAAVAQVRRDDARAHALLFYNQHAADIADRFPRTRLVEFMKRFMADEHPPDVVERRGAELESVIAGHLKRVGRSAQPATLADILAWRDSQRTQLAAMGLDEEMRDYLDRQLSEQFDRLLELALQGNM